MTHPSQRRTIKRIASAPLERVAIEIGYITIFWAWLEDAVDTLIAALIPIEADQVAEAVLGNADMRQKIQMIKALSFMIRGQSLDWHREVVETINTIDVDLRARRNLYTHSAWYTPKGKLTRQKKTVRISKPQSFQEPQLQTIERVPFKIKEARKMRKDILAATKKIVFQTAFVMESDYCALHDISYEQFLRLAALSVRQQRKKVAPPRQRQASQA